MAGKKTLGRTWMVVSGASKGFGAAVCQEMAPYFETGSVIVGMARSKEGLSATSDAVRRANSDVKFHSCAIDFTSTSAEEIEKCFKSSGGDLIACFERYIIVHNVGSLGELVHLRQLNDWSGVRKYFDLNLCSAIAMNSVFLKMVAPVIGKTYIDVVNVSSLLALQPFRTWGLYCSAKAARDMVFRVLAEEEPNVRVLNYAPGPLDTDMQVIARSETTDMEIREMFKNMKEENKLLCPRGSAKKMVCLLLLEGKFVTGDHVDYYDIDDGPDVI